MNTYLIMHGADSEMWTTEADSKEAAIEAFVYAEVYEDADVAREAICNVFICQEV